MPYLNGLLFSVAFGADGSWRNDGNAVLLLEFVLIFRFVLILFESLRLVRNPPEVELNVGKEKPPLPPPKTEVCVASIFVGSPNKSDSLIFFVSLDYFLGISYILYVSIEKQNFQHLSFLL